MSGVVVVEIHVNLRSVLFHEHELMKPKIGKFWVMKAFTMVRKGTQMANEYEYQSSGV